MMMRRRRNTWIRLANRPLKFSTAQRGVYAPIEVCKREQIFPNALAYNESNMTLAVIVKRSSGGDFAFGQGGLNYLRKALDHGALKDGSPLQQAIIVLADVDSQQRIKIVKQFTAENPRRRSDWIARRRGVLIPASPRSGKPAPIFRYLAPCEMGPCP